MNALEHRVDVVGSYNMLRDDPARNYGISTCRIYFYVIGPLGAVQLVLGTDWAIQSVRDHLSKFPSRDERQPQAWDIGYHSHKPMYEGHTPMHGKCELLGGKCFYDGSTLNAENWIEGFCAGGTDWLWPCLEQEYRARFEGGEWPDLAPIYRQHPDDIKAAEAVST